MINWRKFFKISLIVLIAVIVLIVVLAVISILGIMLFKYIYIPNIIRIMDPKLLEMYRSLVREYGLPRKINATTIQWTMSNTTLYSTITMSSINIGQFFKRYNLIGNVYLTGYERSLLSPDTFTSPNSDVLFDSNNKQIHVAAQNEADLNKLAKWVQIKMSELSNDIN